MLFPEAQQQPVVLIRFSADVCDLWQAALTGQLRHCEAATAKLLIAAFAQRVSEATHKIFSYEKSSLLAQELHTFLPDSNEIPWASEYEHVAEVLKEKDHVALFDSIYPLFDVATSQTLYLMHEEYLADFSFGENFPAGMAPVFFSKMLFETAALRELAEVMTGQNSLATYLKQNINQFHVEIHYEEPDLRLLRFDFSCRNERSLARTARFVSLVDRHEPLLPQIESLLSRQPELAFFLPSYLEVELYSGCEFACTFCPRQFTQQETYTLKEEYLNKIIEFIGQGAGDVTVALGGMGEPLEHPQALDFIVRLLDTPRLAQLILETNGRWLEKLAPVLNHPSFLKLKVIVNINSLKRYEELHGVSRDIKEATLQAVTNWNARIKEKGWPTEKTTWMQTLKILDNEDEIDELYAFCEEGGMSFLFQKYNRFAGLMPEKRVSDMTPLERSFCWHLRRDMFIRADGSVAFCKQDVRREKSRGHMDKMSLIEIWRTQLPDWQNNYLNKLATQPNCAICDEYFTFNA